MPYNRPARTARARPRDRAAPPHHGGSAFDRGGEAGDEGRQRVAFALGQVQARLLLGEIQRRLRLMLGRDFEAEFHRAGRFDEILEGRGLRLPPEAADATVLQGVRPAPDLGIGVRGRLAQRLGGDRIDQAGPEERGRVPPGQGRDRAQEDLALDAPRPARGRGTG